MNSLRSRRARWSNRNPLADAARDTAALAIAIGRRASTLPRPFASDPSALDPVRPAEIFRTTLCGVEMGLRLAGVPRSEGGANAAMRILPEKE